MRDMTDSYVCRDLMASLCAQSKLSAGHKPQDRASEGHVYTDLCMQGK